MPIHTDALNISVILPLSVNGDSISTDISFSDAVIELPSIEKQKKIVKILKSSKKCLDMRNTQMAFLDGLIKARFVEMFGDAVANPKKWPVKKLKDLSVQINSGNSTF